MKISGAVLFEALKDKVKYDSNAKHVDMQFNCVTIVVPENGIISKDKLYVCNDTDAKKFASRYPNAYFAAVVSDADQIFDSRDNVIALCTKMKVKEIYSLLEDRFIQISNWIDKLREAVYYGASLQELVDISENVIGQYFAISDYSFRLLAYTKNTPTRCKIANYLKNHGSHSAETIAEFEKTNSEKKWASGEFYAENSFKHTPFATAGFIYRFSNTYFNHAVMTMDSKEIQKCAVELFRIFGETIKPIVARDWEKAELFTHLYDGLLSDLIKGKQEDEESIRVRATYAKMPYSGKIMLFVIKVSSTGDYSIGRLGNEFHNLSPESYVSLVDDELLYLEFFSEKSFESELKERCKSINSILKKNSLTCGAGSAFENLSQMNTAYHQAKKAIIVNQKNKNAGCGLKEFCVDEECFKLKSARLVLFNEVYEYCFADVSREKLEIIKNSKYFRALKILYEYDVEHRINNLQILRVYLENERKTSGTAEKMHMHRNNITYRIQKIIELTKLDLDNPRERFRILLTYSMMRQTNEKEFFSIETN